MATTENERVVQLLIADVTPLVWSNPVFGVVGFVFTSLFSIVFDSAAPVAKTTILARHDPGLARW